MRNANRNRVSTALIHLSLSMNRLTNGTDLDVHVLVGRAYREGHRVQVDALVQVVHDDEGRGEVVEALKDRYSMINLAVSDSIMLTTSTYRYSIEFKTSLLETQINRFIEGDSKLI